MATKVISRELMLVSAWTVKTLHVPIIAGRPNQYLRLKRKVALQIKTKRHPETICRCKGDLKQTS